MSAVNPTDDDRMMSAKEVAAMLGMSERTIHRLRSAAKFPEPRKIGRSDRWWKSKVKDWVDNGGRDNSRDQQ